MRDKVEDFFIYNCNSILEQEDFETVEAIEHYLSFSPSNEEI